MKQDIRPEKSFLIAEVAQAHDGSLGLAHSYIDAIAGAGFDCAKFQMHIAAEESSEHEKFRVSFSRQDKTRFDYWKRMEFTYEQWQGLKAHCEEKGLEFLCSPFSIAAVEQLEALGVRRYKIGSGEVTNDLLLEHIAATGKPIILSSGMSGYAELDRAVEIFRRGGNSLSIVQCTTSYPTCAENIGLNVISELKNRYKVPTGLSDHSGTIFPSLAAVSLGASIIEVHIVFDRAMFGPDATSSLTPAELTQLAQGIRMIESMLNHPVDKNSTENFAPLKIMFGKSIALRNDLKAGHVLELSDLIDKKPGDRGIPAAQFRSVIGKRLRTPKTAHSFLAPEDLEK